MNDKKLEQRIKELEELSKQGFKCDNIRCEHYEEYTQCYDHSHVICPSYQEFYLTKKRTTE